MCGVFVEFERAMIRERVKAGLERARTQGKTLGRPRTPKVVENKIRAECRKGKGIKKISRELGIGVSTVQRVVHEPTPRTGHLWLSWVPERPWRTASKRLLPPVIEFLISR